MGIMVVLVCMIKPEGIFNRVYMGGMGFATHARSVYCCVFAP